MHNLPLVVIGVVFVAAAVVLLVMAVRNGSLRWRWKK